MSQIELLRILQETDLNLSKAAEKMHIVQSAVSRQLHLFEAELGSPLFERQGKKLVGMTRLGIRIMDEIAIITGAKTNIQNIAADFLDSNKGILHIATTHAQAKYFLPEPISQFREKYPGVSIYILQASPEQLIDQLHARKADIAICTEKVDEIPDPWTSPVAFYACYKAKFKEQSYGEAEIFKQEYTRQAQSVLATTYTRRMPSPYSAPY